VTERPIGEDDLHAHVDGRLEPARAQAVADYLSANPDAARRVDAHAAQRDALRAALAPIAAEPLPAELRLPHLVERRHLLRRRWRGPWTQVAAGLVLMLGGMAGGWSLRGLSGAPQNGVGALAREAADTYAVYADDPVHPVEMDGGARADLQRWIADRLHRQVMVPDLARAGYRLLGGRLVSTPHGPAGLFLYQDSAGARLGMLVRPMAVDKTARMARHDYGALAGYSWADDGMGYSLVGRAATPALHPMANEVRRQVLTAG
jgi:anti-sigma factor RsiW